VLSGCSTGRGRATLSGDLVGLAGSLLSGGVRDVIASLWPVDDVAGCLLMDRFYDVLRTSPVPDALHQASSDIRRRSAQLAPMYEKLRQSVGGPPADPGPRGTDRSHGYRGAEAVFSGHPYFWAPFVHIGI